MVEKATGSSKIPRDVVVQDGSPKAHEILLERKLFWVKLYCVVALCSWFFVFAGGAVIETLPSRIAIGPISAIDGIKDIDGLRTIGQIVGSCAPLDLSASTSDPQKVDQEKKDEIDRARIRTALIQWSYGMKWPCMLKHFLLCFFFYTPINLAILSFLSGFVGGNFANFYVYSRDLARLKWSQLSSELKEMFPKQEDAKAAEEATTDPPGVSSNITDERRLFLEEPPLTSAIRGFISYVWFISGLYVFLSQPFVETSTSEYLKIAGMVSAVAFAFGYDPTRINQLFGLLPGAKVTGDTRKAR